MPVSVRALTIAALLVIGAAALRAQTRPPITWPPLTLTPPDVERAEPALGRLRDRLLAAIRARRLDRVRLLVAPTVRDQDQDVPRAELLQALGPLPGSGPLPEEWQALEQALAIGGIRRGALYVVPFIERDAPEWKARTERLFVSGEAVPLYADADAGSEVVARVSHALVQEAVGVPTKAGADGAACRDWTPIVGPERRLVWACTAVTRPVSGLYYAFARTAGAWKLARVYSLPE